MNSKTKFSLNKKFLTFVSILMIISIMAVGITAYKISKQELDNKGKVILKNSVKMAKLLIESKTKEVESGEISKEEAMESIKSTLSGELQDNGSRVLNSNIDLGENGYFLIYDLNGNEIMHPTLEGLNVWHIKDLSNKDFYVVQDQIEKGLNGGGFTYYTWHYPHSVEIGRKVTYSEYYSNWEWIICAGTYMVDFNKGAIYILKVLFFITISLLAISMLISSRYVYKITKPIEDVLEGMKEIGKGKYKLLGTEISNDEVGFLVKGYNQMVNSINEKTSNLKISQDRITYLAYNDELSKLPNRNKLEYFVNNRISSGCDMGHLIQMDILDFKAINSIVGYDKGNEIIRTIGECFSEYKTNLMMVARTSGNEFSFWVENMTYLEINEWIQKFTAYVDRKLEEIEIRQNIEFHNSMVTCPEQGDSFEIIYQKASMAMKYAKEYKEIKLYKFEDTMRKAIESEALMRKYLKEAIDNKEIYMVYQDKVDINNNNNVVGVEALARWSSKELGNVSPDIFIPAVNKSNLTSIFGTYILELVLSEYRLLQDMYNDNIKVSINISPLFFLEENFIYKVKDQIERFNILPENIILEITEDIFIDDFGRIKGIINNLREFGFKISLDDFGTGYSSLNYLKNLTIDELKIDKSFVDEVIEDEKVFKLFEFLCNLASVYNYDIVVEGVETPEQLKKIKEANFSIVQGYLFSKPKRMYNKIN